MFSTQ